ncbi:MAG: hypothetical protein GY794_13680 [bacterium]|nr:hypothetical protein [bacterium]
MSLVNSIVGVLFDLMLAPFKAMPPLVGIAVLSLLASVGMLYSFKWASNQEKLGQIKRKIHAALFEIRLFNDDMPAILKAQGAILRHNLRYLTLCLVPMVFILPPFVLLMAQMESYYGWEGLEPGHSAVLTVTLDQNARGARPEIILETPEGVRVETPGVWAPALGEISWRIGSVSEGDHELSVLLDGQRQIKTIPVGSERRRLSPVRPGGAIWDQLLYAAETPLPEDSPMLEISLTLAGAEVSVFGLMRLHWIIVFFLLTVIFVLALRKPLGVII